MPVNMVSIGRRMTYPVICGTSLRSLYSNLLPNTDLSWQRVIRCRLMLYVSMLSEKHRGSSFPFVKGMCTGAVAWLSALGKKERSSSMIYVFRKKR